MIDCFRNAKITSDTLSGYCAMTPWPAPLICTNQAPGIFSAKIKGLSK